MISKQKIKFINSLKHNKYRSKYNCFIAEGIHVVNDFVNSNFSIKEIYITSKVKNNFSHPVNLISCQELLKISSFKNPPGVLAVVSKPNNNFILKNILKKKRIILLDSISDPGNMGAIIRTADWFGIDTIYISENSVDVFNSKVVQSSMGSLSRVSVCQVSLLDVVSEIKSKNIICYSASISGQSIYEIKPPDQFAVIFGSESHGISDSIRRYINNPITIPTINQKIDSLNVSVAFGIILSQFR